MKAHDTSSQSRSIQSRIALTILTLGLIGQVLMTVIEDEPAAVFVGMILIGGVWYAITRFRHRGVT